MIEDVQNLESELSHRFWDWMEQVTWLKPTEDLYATMVDRDLGIDLAAEVKTPGGERIILVVEVKMKIQPSDVRPLIAKLRQCVDRPGFREGLANAGPFEPGARYYPILAARWLSPRTVQRIAEEKDVGWFDLVGNAHFNFPGCYIHAEGVPNPFSSKERTISWTSVHAQRVLRELLEPRNIGTHWKQRDLSMACFPKVSLGTVNKVAQRLVASAYAEETDQGLLLTDPAGLLRDWGAKYRPLQKATGSFYTTLHGDELTARLAKLCRDHRTDPPDTKATFALAGSSAAVWFAPFVRSPSLCLYTTPTGERALIEELDLQPVKKGANVTLWVTPSSDAFRYRIDLPNGITTTSMAQTYLDLQAMGERGKEAAEHLLTQKLKPLWDEWKLMNQ